VRWILGGGTLILSLCLGGIAGAQTATWQPIGPRPTTGGQVENIVDGEVVGAVKAIAPHPSNKDVVFVGTVNGGIWMTVNATDSHPTWKSQTDAQQSLSTGALEFDPTDAGARTLVAGIGVFSSLGVGGNLTGLLRTTDGGANWTSLNGGGTLGGMNVSGVAPRGATIVVAANSASDFANLGIWRSVDTGASWSQVSGASGTGLPEGPSFDLAGDPGNPNRLYTNGGNSSLYRSDDGGKNWVKKSSPAMDGLIADAVNVKISVVKPSWVYVAIVDGEGVLSGVFVSKNNGDAWTAMDLPMIPEGGINPGTQGQIHMAIAADPNRPNLVYIGGDSQIGNFDIGPNSIGARDYSGILFRGDANQPAGSQWVHLTHSNMLGATGGGTAHSSAPHADSRALEVAADGVLLLGCDGGIYRRTSPQDNTGDWFSMNGNLQSTEFHAVAYDANAHVVIGGAQDTGTPEEPGQGGLRWQSVTKGDGGVVAVDTLTIPGRSVRYSSYYNLGQFRRQVYDAGNALVSDVLPSLTVIGGGNPLAPQFYTPIRLNTVKPAQFVLGGKNSVYESLNQGDTITEIGPGIEVNGSGPNPIAYGAADNVNALYVGSEAQVFVRTGTNPAGLTASPTYSGGTVAGIAIDPGQFKTAYVADPNKVFRTTDAGANWTEITGNLSTFTPGTLRSIAYSTRSAAGAVVVGSDNGVYVASGPGFNTWSLLAKGLPNAPVFHIEYNAQDGIYLAGTLGRGAWVLKP
jgi:hypothetical protein